MNNAANYDKQELKDVLLRCIGTRNITEFAEETGITRFAISKCLNGRYRKPPGIEMIKTFVEHAQGGVCLEDFTRALGYTNKDDTIPVNVSQCIQFIDNIMHPKERWILDRTGTNWCEMISSDGNERWLFIFWLFNIDSASSSEGASAVIKMGGQLLFCNETCARVTFVTDSAKTYAHFGQVHITDSLNMSVSALLILNDKDIKILSEYIMKCKEDDTDFRFTLDKP